jgi:hypothetical protein
MPQVRARRTCCGAMSTRAWNSSQERSEYLLRPAVPATGSEHHRERESELPQVWLAAHFRRGGFDSMRRRTGRRLGVVGGHKLSRLKPRRATRYLLRRRVNFGVRPLELGPLEIHRRQGQRGRCGGESRCTIDLWVSTDQPAASNQREGNSEVEGSREPATHQRTR